MFSLRPIPAVSFSVLLLAIGSLQPVVAATGSVSASPKDSEAKPALSAASGCVHSGSWKASMPNCPEPTLVVEDENSKIVFAIDDSEFFGIDQVKLDDEAKADLDEIVNAVHDVDRIRRITVTGHADEIGPAPYNVALAMRRAQAVKRFLVDRGVPVERIFTIGDSDSAPLVGCPGIKSENKLVRCLAPNRRVDVEAVLADSFDIGHLTLTPTSR